MWRAVVLSVMCSFLGNTAGAGTVLYVDDDAPSGGDGATWETAFRFLRDALSVVNTPGSGVSEVRIAQGTYKPDQDEANPKGTGDINQSFTIVSGLTLQGGYAGLGASDPDVYDSKQFVTMLSGDLNGDDGPDFANYKDNCLHVVSIQSAQNDVCLKGLTIYGGHAAGDEPWSPESQGAGVNCLEASTLMLYECRFDRNWTSGCGAGLHAPAGSIVINSCSFLKNESHDCKGGGAYIEQGTVSNSLFSECVAPFYNTGSGGGLWCSTASILNCQFVDCVGSGVSCGSNTSITSCEFIGNSGEGGGGVVFFEADNVRILNSTFLDNGATCGGAIECRGDGHVIVNCHFLGNHAGITSAMEIEEGSVSLVNCVFSGNGPDPYTLRIHEGQLTLVNCTFSLNVNKHGSPTVLIGRLALTSMLNCIMWGNTNEDRVGEAAQIEAYGAIMVNSCTVEGWTGILGGVGNDGLDPLFIDPDGADDIPGTLDDDCRLAADSPSRNAGNNNYLPPDIVDLDGDGDISEPIPLDLDLLPRISQGTVDRGPYEFHPICAADLFPDVDGFGDGLIGPGDLAQLLAKWGPCPEPCPADIWPDAAPDGVVGAGDLATLLVHWGQCE